MFSLRGQPPQVVNVDSSQADVHDRRRIGFDQQRVNREDHAADQVDDAQPHHGRHQHRYKHQGGTRVTDHFNSNIPVHFSVFPSGNRVCARTFSVILTFSLYLSGFPGSQASAGLQGIQIPADLLYCFRLFTVYPVLWLLPDRLPYSPV